MQKRYSRLANTEAKRNVKTAVRFGVLTIATIALLFFFGIPFLGRFAGFISDLSGSKSPITRNDKTPPAPPQVNSLPEFTNQKEIKLTGSSEEGATIRLTFNSDKREVVAGTDGEFNFDLNLRKGSNSFDLMAIDQAGNESQKTRSFDITFDDEKPDLVIDSPQEGSQFYGSGQKQVTIKGKTETDVHLAINGKFVSVGSEGAFEFTDSLNDGENKFNMKSTDLAGNLTEKDLVVFFTP